VKNPHRTIRIAGALAIGLVTLLYILANIAYFSGASLKEIRTSGLLVATLLVRNVYGPRAERALAVFISLSALGNVLSTVRGINFH
jgi:amino acid transporter